MTLFDALILGLVEGITEFLPISSTGHLIIAQNLLGLPSSAGLDAYLIVIQFGAIAAVAALYPGRIAQMFTALGDVAKKKFSSPAVKLVRNLLIAFIPAAVIGLMFDNTIENCLFNTPAVAAALIFGAVIMLWASRAKAGQGKLDSLSVHGGFRIGLWQILSLWPGMSRSMTTIVSGQLCGLSRAAAAEFSFLLGAVTLLAASFYKGIKHHEEIAALGLVPVLVGMLAAFVSAFVVVRLFVGLLTRFGLVPWALYRIGLAVVILL